MAVTLVASRRLIASLVRREIAGRYRGSVLGLFWSVVTPIVMLAVYTFVFTKVFQSEWPGGSGSTSEFALVLFAGLMLFNFFAECLTRAPALIISNANYVKKVVFPLEILPVVAVGSALFHLAISVLVWCGFYFVVLGVPPATALLLPVIVLPLVLITQGITWLLAALGVYLRDVVQLVGVLVLVLMFLSPVFYPVERLDESVRVFLYLGPVTVAIEQARDVLMWGRMPGWWLWAVYTAVSALVAWLGYYFFQTTRRGFADVL